MDIREPLPDEVQPALPQFFHADFDGEHETLTSVAAVQLILSRLFGAGNILRIKSLGSPLGKLIKNRPDFVF